jgi:methylglutaconyl-CoA hydratase
MAGIIIRQLCDAMGARQVRRYALTGERFDAREARRIGLVHEVVPRADLEAARARLVDQILNIGPRGARADQGGHAGLRVGRARQRAFDRLIVQHAARRRSAEAAEGLDSFRERRPARWYPGPVR